MIGEPGRRMVRWAQRRAAFVPAPVRRLARRSLSSAAAGPPDDWTVPLIPGRGGAGIASLPGPPVIPAAARATIVTSPRLRCLVVTDVLDVGGMDEFVAFLGRRLPSLGIETVVGYAGEQLAGHSGEGGRVRRELAAEGVPLAKLSEKNAAAWLRSYGPDVISAHAAPDWLVAAGVRQGVPVVQTLHGMHGLVDPGPHPEEERRARDITAFVTVSELVRRQYLARNPQFDADRIVTVPNGMDDSWVPPVDRSAARAALGLRDEFLFLSLARYNIQKNTFGLVSAFAAVAAENPLAHLLVAGRPDDDLYAAQIMDLARSTPDADRIHLRGHCARPSALLAAADAFVLDSYFEGWPLASMEALLTGTPIVMSDVGGAREQVGAGGERGYLVPNPCGDPDDVDWETMRKSRFRSQPNRPDLVAALTSAVRDRDIWAAGRPGLREEARTLFSADTCLARHAAVLTAAALSADIPHFTAGIN